jgi:DNA-binding NtrC family response regulator
LEAIKRLLAHGWPGNIRELENVVQRELINGNETGAILRKDAPAPATPSNASGFLSLDENERRHIIATLSHTRGKVHGPGGAAELLKINPSTLASRIKKMGIDKKSYQRK